MKKLLNKNICDKTEYIENAKKILVNINNKHEKVDYIEYLLNFLTRNVTEYMSDSFIEEELNKISDELHQENSLTFENKKILHIISEAYPTGGHTKLAELFIKNIAHIYNQDVLLTKQKSEIPRNLLSLNEIGEIICLEDNGVFEKSKDIFNIASKYSYIVLHTHNDDVLVNLTFGTKKFKRPVIFVNHSDHAFWCGGSVADIVLELSSEGKDFSKEIRGINYNAVMNIPIEKKKINFSKQDARNILSIDEDKKLILSIGTEYKYGRTKDEVKKFIRLAKNIVNSVDNSEFVLIGPSRKNKYWNEAYESTNGKINAIGIQNRELLEQYAIASDLYIESFPFASYSAYLEIISFGINALTLKNEVFSLNIVKKYNLECDSIKEIEEKAIIILSSKTKKEEVISIEEHLKEKWSENIINIIEKLEVSSHNVYDLNGKKAPIEYLNHVDKIIGNSLGINFTYKKLPILLKLKLAKLMIKYNIIRNFSDFFKLVERIAVFK